MVVKYYKIEERYEHNRYGRYNFLPEYSRYSMFDLETSQTVSLYLLPKKEFGQLENYIAIKCYKGSLGWYKLEKPFSAYKLDVVPLN
ncbi:hypothetical protein FACS189426_02000 [Bacteroidia bacterium]|nr:hypothetical protein FACS189426_02000 [Bacteroidia bacterium]GHV72123.1 hypothetical protein FACS189420_8740 [Bacteroidia bacterium]